MSERTDVAADSLVIYADCAATQPLTPAVRAAMEPFLDLRLGNASSAHASGREASRVIREARQRIADVLGCAPEEIFFTSGGTESDNWAIKGCAFYHRLRGHLAVSAIEHRAVLSACDSIEALGMTQTLILPGPDGIVTAESVASAMRQDTCLAAVMLANNEIGTIQPIPEIAEAVHARGAHLLCDAVQGLGQIPVLPRALGADMLALSGHKIGAPAGIGLLYIREGVPILPLLDGGGQEMGMRAGTENVAAIAGLAAAVEEAARMRGAESLYQMQNLLFEKLLAIPGCVVNGTRAHGKRLPGNVHVSFVGLDSESLVLHLDRMGIRCSAGAACSAGKHAISHVLTAIGCDEARASSGLRFTLSADVTVPQVERIAACTARAVEMLRAVRG